MKSERTRQYTLHELAAAAGMTVRNVRSYQTRGLIPPPRRQGRHSVYDAEHLKRLRAIHQARARGASLSLIGSHLSQGGTLNGESLDSSWLPLRQAAAGPTTTTRGSGRRASVDRMLSGPSDDPAIADVVAGLVAAGVLQRSGHRLVAAPTLAAGVGNLAKHGLPVERSLEVAGVAAEVARTLQAAMHQALAASPASDRVKVELVDLVAGVLGTVIRLDLDGSVPQD